MIDRLLPDQCTGCGCCVDGCPKNAIELSVDKEGFGYPIIDSELCIRCELCEKICPIMNVNQLPFADATTKADCYGGYHKDIEIRFDSTSGGAYTALAESVLNKGDYVCGAVYDKDFAVHQIVTNNPEDLRELRSSKYQQSNAVGIYRQVKELLDRGEFVLFCGTPCHCAAFRTFLRKDYERLVLVDFVCHGVASPLFHKKYLDYIQEQNKAKLVRFKAKNKELGWRNLTKRFDFQEKKTLYVKVGDDVFSTFYHSDMIYRLSCYNCHFSGSRRVSDLTLFDFWGVEKSHPQLDNDTGTSAILVNTDKGKDLWGMASRRMVFEKARWEEMAPYNPYLSKQSRQVPMARRDFFRDLNVLNFREAINGFKSPFPRRNNLFYMFLRMVRRIILDTRLRPRPLFQFVYYNFLSGKVEWNLRKGAFLFPSPYCALSLDKSAKIKLEGPLRLGIKRIASSRFETRLLMEKNTILIVKKEFHLGYGSNLEIYEGGKLEWGSGGCSSEVVISCGEHITVGDHVSLARGTTIRDTNGHIIAITGFRKTRPVHIGNHVWICSNASIMPGVKIGDGAIVGAMSLVCQSVRHHTLVSGNPARYVRDVEYYKL